MQAENKPPTGTAGRGGFVWAPSPGRVGGAMDSGEYPADVLCPGAISMAVNLRHWLWAAPWQTTRLGEESKETGLHFDER